MKLFVDGERTVHLKCEGLAPNVAEDYWKGLEFYNSSKRVVENGNIQINESASILENVDIYYAGVNADRKPIPAIRASPNPPFIINCTVLYSALDATNFSYAKSSTILKGSSLAYSRGMYY